MKRLLIVASRFPYPLNKGDRLRTYHFIRVLSRYFSIILFSTDDEMIAPEHLEQLRCYCEQLYHFPLSTWQRYRNLFRALWQPLPLQSLYFSMEYVREALKEVLIRERPDALLAQTLRITPLLDRLSPQLLPSLSVLDYMDCFSKRYFALANNAKGLRKWAFFMEAQRLQTYEHYLMEYFPFHIIISHSDKNAIHHPRAKEILVIPNGVDIEYFHISDVYAPVFDIGFIGNLGYEPNILAVQFIMEKILPLWRQRYKKPLRILLAGAQPSKEVLRYKNYCEVTLWQNLKDIRAAYSAIKILVAPLFISTGIQNKLLEAMAMQRVVITTEAPAKAIQAQHKKHLWIAYDAESFVQGIAILLNDHLLYQQIAQQARAFIEACYSWEQTLVPLRQLLEGN